MTGKHKPLSLAFRDTQRRPCDDALVGLEGYDDVSRVEVFEV